jgi:hypothetical protein
MKKFATQSSRGGICIACYVVIVKRRYVRATLRGVVRSWMLNPLHRDGLLTGVAGQSREAGLFFQSRFTEAGIGNENDQVPKG